MQAGRHELELYDRMDLLGRGEFGAAFLEAQGGFGIGRYHGGSISRNKFKASIPARAEAPLGKID
jgi:hypothetical protein